MSIGKSNRTRSNIRAEKLNVPEERVYGLVVQDPHADTWESNLIVYAENASTAQDHWRRIGLTRDYVELPHKATDNDDFAVAKQHPGVILLRRATYPGVEGWHRLPAGYIWPHRTLARTSDAGLLPDELGKRPRG